MIQIKGEGYHRDIETDQHGIAHRKNILDALRTHGNETTKELKTVTSTGPRTGRVYTYLGRKYTASAPGEAPALRSGLLANSFSYKANLWRLVVGNTARSKKGFAYSEFLEKSMNRPYFLNTIERLMPRLKTDLLNVDLPK